MLQYSFMDLENNSIFGNIQYGPNDDRLLDFPMHNHSYYEISVMLEGCALHITKTETRTLRPGDAIFVHPWDFHSLKRADAAPVFFINIPFQETVLNNMAVYLEKESSIEALRAHQGIIFGRLGAEDLDILQNLRNDVSDFERMKRALYLLLPRILLDGFLPIDQNLQEMGPAWFQKLCMEMRYADNARDGIQRMYELTDRTPAHISRTFRQYMHTTPTEYLNFLKISNACFQLRHSERSILDVALANGFESASYFYRVFRRIVGITPQEYRNGKKASAGAPFGGMHE